jgi:ferrochelatase
MTTVGVLVMAHGTPHSLDDVAAFYTEIRRGRPPSAEQLAELESRYRAIGGTSPLNDRTAAQLAALSTALEQAAPGRFTVAAGAKFTDPRIEDAVNALAARGARRIVGLVLAPHYSTASVGEYARRATDAALRRHQGIELTVIPHWYDAPGLAALLAQRVRHALNRLGVPEADAAVLFTAHSIPARLVDGGDPYAEQVGASAAAVAAEAGLAQWSVAYQSAGRTDDVWLGPDVRDVIAQLAREGVRGVVVCPIGFVSDHLEVLYDLDVEAADGARHAGIAFSRTSSLNDDPAFCAVLARVVMHAADPSTVAPGA